MSANADRGLPRAEREFPSRRAGAALVQPVAHARPAAAGEDAPYSDAAEFCCDS